MTRKQNRKKSVQISKGLWGKALNKALGKEFLSEEKYRLYRKIFEYSKDGIAIIDLQGHYIQQNPAHERLLGYSDEDLLGSTPGIHLGDEAFSVISSDLASSGSYRGEVISHTKSGEPLDIDISAFAVGDEEGQASCYVGIKRDITERRKADEALRKEKEFSAAIIENAPTFFVAIDSAGKTIMMNRSMLEALGYADYEVKGKNYISNFVPERDREALSALFNSLTSKHQNTLNQNHIICKDGREVLVEWHGTPVFDADGGFLYFYGIGIDISERKKSENLLKESEQRYRILFEQARDVIYFTTPEGRLIDMNKAGLEILGYPKEEFKDLNVADHYMNPTDRLEVKKCLESNGQIKDMEVRLRRKDGAEIICMDSATVLKDNDGMITGYVGTLRDVTEIRNAEKDKAMLEKKLRQAQKMESIGTLAGGIAHDFNNLLMGIQGRTSLMLMDTDATDPHFEHLKEIEEYIKSAVTLTNQLLGFAMAGKYEVIPTDLNALIKKSLDMFGRTKKELSIHAEYQDKLWPVNVDRGQIDQVLLNLFINAWQSMPAGGDLFIETRNLTVDRAYGELYQLKPGRYVQFSITDTGVGIDEKTKERIFDPFFTTKEIGRGTGLGLASAYGIIRHHDGVINVYSEKGHGTTFKILLPACDKPLKDEKTGSYKGIIRGSGTVLFVDDEKIITDVGRQILESLGYDVLIAMSGKEAVDIYLENREKIEIVILDMIMPGIGGGEVFNRLKEINPEVKVLLSSGYSLNGQATEILQRGCDGFIQKPFDIKELAIKMKGILGGKGGTA